MHSTLFAHIPVNHTERYTLQNPQLLKTDITIGSSPVLARQGAMVAFEGQVDFDSQYRNRSWRNAERMTGERLELMRCKGNGVVYLANFAQYLHIMEVGRGITGDSSAVLAFDGSLNVGIVAVDSAVEVASAGAYNLELSGGGKVVLQVTVPTLRGAELAGSGDLRIDSVAGEQFVGDIAGSGNLTVDRLQVGELKIDIAGSGSAKASAGRATKAEYEIAGSGGIDAAGITTEAASVSIAGSGDVTAHASSTADVSIMGSGNVEVKGGAKCNVSKAGSGEVRCG